MLCQGQLLPISQYTALFSILGTTYGGNGQTNFALPDLRGRAPIGAGQGLGLPPYVIGETGGSSQVSLTVNNLPAHNHLLMGNHLQSGKVNPGPQHILGKSPTDMVYTDQPPDTNFAPTAIGVTGSNLPFNNMPPFLAMNYIICINGLYPSRN